jgi:hypothetical protein
MLTPRTGPDPQPQSASGGVLPQASSLEARCDTALTRQANVMKRLYKRDVWEGYLPGPRLEERVQGWNGNHPIFKQLLDTAPNAVFVDVGVWKGQSTMFVAGLMQQGAIDGCVIAVDTFLGSLEDFGAGGKSFDRPQGRPDLFERFLQNVFYGCLTHLIVPLPQTSLLAATLLQHAGITPGIVHLDAAHNYEAVLRDAEAYWPLIARGGYLVGDDYHRAWPGVIRAADELAAKLGIELSIAEPKWILTKPR